MPTSYKEYCKRAYIKNPRFFSNYFNADGSKKKIVWWSKTKKKATDNISRTKLKSLPKSKIKKKVRQPSISITGTQLKFFGKNIDMTIWLIPSNCNRKEYNRIWMHNQRVRTRIKLLKEKYGITYTL